MAPATWVVVGASRGIGVELVRQLLAQGNQVVAAVRTPQTANEIWQLSAKQTRPAACLIEEGDVTNEASIDVSLGREALALARDTRILILSTGIRQCDEKVGGQWCAY